MNMNDATACRFFMLIFLRFLKNKRDLKKIPSNLEITHCLMFQLWKIARIGIIIHNYGLHYIHLIGNLYMSPEKQPITSM